MADRNGSLPSAVSCKLRSDSHDHPPSDPNCCREELALIRNLFLLEIMGVSNFAILISHKYLALFFSTFSLVSSTSLTVKISKIPKGSEHVPAKIFRLEVTLL